jgi:hypothetical protein
VNRSEFRRGGLQGRRGASLVNGTKRWAGRRRGSFLAQGARPSILVSHASGWRDRKIRRLLSTTKTGRVGRTLQRMRAAGTLEEGVSFDDV